MQKNNKHYNFLFTHTTKSKIYIRRIEVSKKLLHSSLAIFILSSGIAVFGVFSLVNTNVLAMNEAADINTALIKQQVAVKQTKPSEPKSFDYNRPSNTENFAINSGGPDSDLQMNEEEIEQSQNGDIEQQIRLIQTTANPNSLPTMWAHLGKINNEFGFRRNPFGGRSYEFHAGMDIDGERGDNVIAPGNGVIIKAGWQGGYGNLIEVDHGNGITTRYGHLSKIEVQVGDTISRGQLIGYVGSTGRSTGPHLHYELRLNDKPINPRLFLPPEPTEIKQG